ncbi:BTB/POZ protein [Rhizophagus irregularis DAOM 181602=DAOM 197198]|nr:BTB/POZ protein [Rhizophagus irregularis DAOM 181602=DAOM 197198]
MIINDAINLNLILERILMDNSLAHIKLSNISPEIFQIILKYIYGGIISLNGQDTSEILNLLLAADELLLQELVDYLQKYLIENKTEWMEQHFELIHRTSFQSNSLLELQQFLEGTEEIIGGYNPIMWSSSDNWGKTKHSFVFSFKEKDIKSAIISNIKDTEHALNYGAKRGPCFGTDIIIRATGEFVNYNIRYQKFFYEKKIRDTGNEFSIEDYEVFQIKERE